MQLKSILETILFVHGEPLTLEELTKAAKVSKEEVTAALEELKDDLKDRGIVVLEKNGAYQLGSNPENFRYVEDMVKSEFSEELTKAAIEVLAIVAYKGPLTRSEIEFIRGVNSAFTLRNLLMRGLVERIEDPKDSRSYLYRISFDALKHFGLRNPEELPRYEEFKKESLELQRSNR